MTQSASIACLSCGASFTYRWPEGDDSGRFCSARCRQWYDAGNPAYESYSAVPVLRRFPVSSLVLGQGPRGALIACFGCGKTFDSIGLRYCSTECQRKTVERRELKEAQGPLADAPSRRRPCEYCGQLLPLFRKGRAVGKNMRFCSPPCQKKARRLSSGSTTPMHANDANKPAPNGLSHEEAKLPSPVADEQ